MSRNKKRITVRLNDEEREMLDTVMDVLDEDKDSSALKKPMKLLFCSLKK